MPNILIEKIWWIIIYSVLFSLTWTKFATGKTLRDEKLLLMNQVSHKKISKKKKHQELQVIPRSVAIIIYVIEKSTLTLASSASQCYYDPCNEQIDLHAWNW